MKPEQELNSAGAAAQAVDPDSQSEAAAASAAATAGQAGVAEPVGAASGGEDAKDAAAPAEELAPEQMLAEIESLRLMMATREDDVLRTQAEMENLRKRSAREVESARKFGLERIINELLPVRDSLELGLAAAGDEGVEVASVREGIELTLKMLDTATGKFGLAEVDPLGEAFDPERHQAISMQAVDGAESGTVLNVVQKGFTLNDRLVRPAMVIVAS